MRLHLTIDTATDQRNSISRRNTTKNRIELVEAARKMINEGSVVKAKVWYESKGVAHTLWSSEIEGKRK